MKVVFKILSNNYVGGLVSDESFSLHFEKVIDYAFQCGIRIWHSSKKIELTKDHFRGSVNYKNMTINWGGYGSSISKEKLFDYFTFMYPGDTETEGTVKSKVNSRNNPFTFCHAVFGSDIDMGIIREFEKLGGIVDQSITHNTLLIVTDSKDLLDHYKSQCTAHGWKRMQWVTGEMLKNVFPINKTTPNDNPTKRVKQESTIAKLYSDQLVNASVVNDRIQFSKIKKLLTESSIEVVDTGLMMIEALNDPILIDTLLEGMELLNCELIPNKIFSGTRKNQPVLNYAMLGVLGFVNEHCRYSYQKKNLISELHIDIPNLRTLSKLTGIERLVLFDSMRSLTTLEGVQNLTSLKGLVLKDCPNIKSIDAIKGLPIQEFEFGKSQQIESFQSLEGKLDQINRKYLEIVKFNNLTSLAGIDFFASLETIMIDECDQITEVKSLKKLQKLKEIKCSKTYGGWNDFSLPNLRSLDGLILSNHLNFKIDVNSWQDLPDQTFNNCKYLDVRCKSMPNLSWLNRFPNLVGLSVNSEDLLDVNGISACKNLLGLVLKSPVVVDLSAVAQLPNLVVLNIEGCIKICNIDFVSGMSTLKLFGSISDLLRIDTNGDSVCLEDLLLGLIDSMKGLHIEHLTLVESWDPLFSLPFFQSQIESIRVWESNTLNVNGISKLKNLKSVSISRCKVTNQLFFELSLLTELEVVDIYGIKEIEIYNESPLNCELTFTNSEIKSIRNGRYKLVKLIESSFVEILNCEVDCLKIKEEYSPEIINLNGLTKNRIKALELESVKGINDLSGIVENTDLSSLNLKKLPKLQNISFLAGLLNLNSLYTEDCERLEVMPKPKGQMNKIDLLNYQYKIAEFYKLSNLNEISNLLKQFKSTKSAEVSSKELSNIKKLLQTRDLDVVISGVQLVSTLNSEALYEALLDGISYNGTTIVPNRIFKGSGPAQPYLNTAMMGVLCSAVSYPKWSNFISEVSTCELEMMVLDYLSCLKNVQSLKVRGVSKSAVLLNLPELRSFVWQSMDWSSDLPKMSTAFNLNVFQNSVKLEKFVVEIPLDIKGDFEEFSSFTNLKELDFIGIRENQINTIRHLSGCKSLETLRIQFDKSVIGGISDLEGLNDLIELKRLVICNTAIKDTGAIRNLKNIEYLEILSPVLEHFTPCGDFSKLLELNFSATNYNSYGNCSALKTMGESVYPANMNQINLRNTAIQKFPRFYNLIRIDQLLLSSTPINDFTEMRSIEKIGDLDIDNCEEIIDFTGFENITEIGDLDMTGCSKLVSFKGMQRVKYQNSRLDLSGCFSLKSIEELPMAIWNLIILDTETLPLVKAELACEQIRCHSVKNLERIGNYLNVTGFDFSLGYYNSKHPLVDYSPLRDVPKLKKLRINSDKAISLESFAHFEHLEILNLVGCKQLTNPEKLANTHIDRLYIADCNLKKAQFPESLQDKIDWQSKP